MKTHGLAIEGAYIIEPDVYPDQRGYFAETYQKIRYANVGIKYEFVQDNISSSVKNTMRGLHYQMNHCQGHLIHVLRGVVFDVGLDLRQGSSTFGRHIAVTLEAESNRQLFLPPGVAHGFCALGEDNLIYYKCTDYYDSTDECGVNADDPDLGIEWPIPFEQAIRTDRDSRYRKLKDLPVRFLPSISK